MSLAALVFVSVAAFAAPAAAATGSSVTLEGTVVCCAECWAKADRNRVEYGTAEDLAAARRCIAAGDPTLLAVPNDDGEFRMLLLEPGSYRPPGPNWLPLVGSRVRATGSIEERDDTTRFRVDALEVVRRSRAERDTEAIAGSQIELELPDLAGVRQQLSALRGRVVVLNFWATWCLPCREEMPELEAIQEEYGALGVQVIGASADAPADRAKVLGFVREVNVSFPIWLGASADAMRAFGLSEALPGTVVVGRDGRIVRAITGPVTRETLRSVLEPLVAQPSEEPANDRSSSARSTVPS